MAAWGGSIEVISLWEYLYWSLSIHNEDINFITHLSHWLCPVDIVLHYLFCYLRVLKKSTTVELKPLKYFITENVGSACKFSSQTVFISVHIYMLLQTPGFYFILTNVRVNGWIAVELLRAYMSIILYQDLNKSPVKQFCGFLQLERSEAVVKKKKKRVHGNGWPYQQKNPQEHLEWIHCYMLTSSGEMASEILLSSSLQQPQAEAPESDVAQPEVLSFRQI